MAATKSREMILPLPGDRELRCLEDGRMRVHDSATGRFVRELPEGAAPYLDTVLGFAAHLNKVGPERWGRARRRGAVTSWPDFGHWARLWVAALRAAECGDGAALEFLRVPRALHAHAIARGHYRDLCTLSDALRVYREIRALAENAGLGF